MKGITKKFGDFTANDNIDLTIHKGEVHALLGENGAGKTTLMNQLYGLYRPTSGEIYINGRKVDVSNANVAIQNGIGMVHQHFMLVKPFTVTENIILGKEITRFGGVLDMKKASEKIRELSEKYGLHVDPNSRIQDITVGMEQRVEILKTLYRGADILILDEPTAVLTPQEIHDLIRIIRNLTGEGKSVIIITHKLQEIKAAADYCTIIRRGKHIDTVDVSRVDENELAAKMVGREVSFKVEKDDREGGSSILEIDNLVVKDNRGIKKVNGFSLNVKKGEILGLAGVDGNGQSELIEAITGLRKTESGTVRINNMDITSKTPRDVIQSKISTIPEDRQKHGLVMNFNVAENMILENYSKNPFSKNGILNFNAIKKYANDLIAKFDVRPDDPYHKAGSLSGGNQQKVIIAREVSNDPDVLIAAQPTRGLDVGAIEFVHKSLVDQRNRGKAVLLVSLELDEIMNVSDRIAVIYEGKVAGVIDAKGADENEIGLMMAGGK
ncbi:MAG: ABC transporter ATP-binding protein [Spirochaetes bacterium]|nr:ABC transporter ATP-binding protein [Spirochaetota bacterium]